MNIKYYVIREDRATNPLAGPKYYSFNWNTATGCDDYTLTDFTTASRFDVEATVKAFAKSKLNNYKIFEIQVREVEKEQ